jgi:hypothetical protein
MEMERRLLALEQATGYSAMRGTATEYKLNLLLEEVTDLKRSTRMKPAIQVNFGLGPVISGCVEPWVYEGKIYFRSNEHEIWEVEEAPVSTQMADEVIVAQAAIPNCPWWVSTTAPLDQRWRMYKGKRYVRGRQGDPKDNRETIYEVKMGKWVGVYRAQTGVLDTTIREPAWVQ